MHANHSIGRRSVSYANRSTYLCYFITDFYHSIQMVIMLCIYYTVKFLHFLNLNNSVFFGFLHFVSFILSIEKSLGKTLCVNALGNYYILEKEKKNVEQLPYIIRLADKHGDICAHDHDSSKSSVLSYKDGWDRCIDAFYNDRRRIAM